MDEMEGKQDIRWKQRYTNFHRACRKLLEVTEADKFIDDYTELEKEGVVQRFEYTFELAWKVLQDFLNYKGYTFVSGPNGTLRMAFEDGLIANHDDWRNMAKARNILSHIYDEEDVKEIILLIFNKYAALLKDLDRKLNQLSQNPSI